MGKELCSKFVMTCLSFLYSHLDFNLDRTLYFFIAGRYAVVNYMSNSGDISTLGMKSIIRVQTCSLKHLLGSMNTSR